MSHKVDRLRLIRERHRKLILQPRRQVDLDRLDEEWNEEFDFIDEEVLTRQLRCRAEDK